MQHISGSGGSIHQQSTMRYINIHESHSINALHPPFGVVLSIPSVSTSSSSVPNHPALHVARRWRFRLAVPRARSVDSARRGSTRCVATWLGPLASPPRAKADAWENGAGEWGRSGFFWGRRFQFLRKTPFYILFNGHSRS